MQVAGFTSIENRFDSQRDRISALETRLDACNCGGGTPAPVFDPGALTIGGESVISVRAGEQYTLTATDSNDENNIGLYTWEDNGRVNAGAPTGLTWTWSHGRVGTFHTIRVRKHVDLNQDGRSQNDEWVWSNPVIVRVI